MARPTSCSDAVPVPPSQPATRKAPPQIKSCQMKGPMDGRNPRARHGRRLYGTGCTCFTQSVLFPTNTLIAVSSCVSSLLEIMSSTWSSDVGLVRSNTSKIAFAARREHCAYRKVPVSHICHAPQSHCFPPMDVRCTLTPKPAAELVVRTPHTSSGENRCLGKQE